eukprot:m.808486 g.808486  ORF g.808486 m.808486 type:complete len:292 (-) comp59311_c1_seq30:7-882(-)
MLCTNSQERLTAVGLLSHEWMNPSVPSPLPEIALATPGVMISQSAALAQGTTEMAQQLGEMRRDETGFQLKDLSTCDPILKHRLKPAGAAAAPAGIKLPPQVAAIASERAFTPPPVDGTKGPAVAPLPPAAPVEPQISKEHTVTPTDTSAPAQLQPESGPVLPAPAVAAVPASTATPTLPFVNLLGSRPAQTRDADGMLIPAPVKKDNSYAARHNLKLSIALPTSASKPMTLPTPPPFTPSPSFALPALSFQALLKYIDTAAGRLPSPILVQFGRQVPHFRCPEPHRIWPS